MSVYFSLQNDTRKNLDALLKRSDTVKKQFIALMEFKSLFQCHTYLKIIYIGTERNYSRLLAKKYGQRFQGGTWVPRYSKHKRLIEACKQILLIATLH